MLGLRVGLAFTLGVTGIACAALFVRWALPAPPIVTGFYRMTFASVLLVAILGARTWRSGRRERRAGARPVGPPLRARLLALAAGACFGCDIAMWHGSLVRTSVANATLLVNTTPLHVGLFTAFVLRKPLGRGYVPGSALAFAGAAVLLGLEWSDAAALRGDLLALAAALFYTAYLLLMSGARQGLDALAATTSMSVSAACVLGLAAVCFGDPFTGFPTHSWLSMLAAALVSQIGGVFGIVWSLRYMPAPFASVALLGQPVVATLLAWVWLGEALGLLELLGAAAVLAGIGVVSLGETTRMTAPAPGATNDR